MKKTFLFIGMVLLTIPIYSQINVSKDKLAENSNPKTIEQFTPDQADWSTFYSKPDAASSVDSHDPDGITWISSWPTWDGTIYNPSEMTQTEFTEAICPSGDAIRGIREVFYNNAPFADNANPTKAEVDEWHKIAINHIRAMVGYTSTERQVKKDHCMSARALWSQERKWTTKWDEAYPEGTCDDSSGPHCGAAFIPSLEDQAPYLPDGHPGCSQTAGAEGVSNAPKSNIPWSVKWSRAFCQYLGAEGFWGGHVGPFYHREKFGFSFWDRDINDSNSNATLRAKWTGALSENLYNNTLSISNAGNLDQESKLSTNPVDDLLKIELAPVYDINSTELKVINMAGMQVVSYPYTSTIDVSTIGSGVYIVKLTDGKTSETIKFLKK